MDYLVHWCGQSAGKVPTGINAIYVLLFHDTCAGKVQARCRQASVQSMCCYFITHVQARWKQGANRHQCRTCSWHTALCTTPTPLYPCSIPCSVPCTALVSHTLCPALDLAPSALLCAPHCLHLYSGLGSEVL